MDLIDILRISETGETFNDVPITRRRSTRGLSANNALSNSSDSFSPKNVISGCVHMKFADQSRGHFQRARAYFDNTRRISRNVRLIFTVVLPRRRVFLFGFLLVLGALRGRGCRTAFTNWNAVFHNFVFYGIPWILGPTVHARCGGEGAVTLQDSLYAGASF